jgi:hypothetical protein
VHLTFGNHICQIICTQFFQQLFTLGGVFLCEFVYFFSRAAASSASIFASKSREFSFSGSIKLFSNGY